MDTYTIRRITRLTDERLEMEKTTVDETTFRTVLWESKSWKLRKTKVDRAYYGTDRMPEYDTAVNEDLPINPDDMLLYEGRFYGIQLFGDFDFLLVNERRYFHDGTRAPHHLVSVDDASYSLWGKQDFDRLLGPFKDRFQGMSALRALEERYEKKRPQLAYRFPSGVPFCHTRNKRVCHFPSKEHQGERDGELGAVIGQVIENEVDGAFLTFAEIGTT